MISSTLGPLGDFAPGRAPPPQNPMGGYPGAFATKDFVPAEGLRGYTSQAAYDHKYRESFVGAARPAYPGPTNPTAGSYRAYRNYGQRVPYTQRPPFRYEGIPSRADEIPSSVLTAGFDDAAWMRSDVSRGPPIKDPAVRPRRENYRSTPREDFYGDRTFPTTTARAPEYEAPPVETSQQDSVWAMNADQFQLKAPRTVADFASPADVKMAMSVAGEFAFHYFHLMQTQPHMLHCFYSNDSQLAHGSSMWQSPRWNRAIGEREIESLFATMLKIDPTTGSPAPTLILRSNVKTLEAQPTRDGGIVMQATGSIETRDLGPRPFAHTIVMNRAPEAGSYVVLHDIFVFLDDLTTTPPAPSPVFAVPQRVAPVAPTQMAEVATSPLVIPADPSSHQSPSLRPPTSEEASQPKTPSSPELDDQPPNDSSSSDSVVEQLPADETEDIEVIDRAPSVDPVELSLPDESIISPPEEEDPLVQEEEEKQPTEEEEEVMPPVEEDFPSQPVPEDPPVEICPPTPKEWETSWQKHEVETQPEPEESEPEESEPAVEEIQTAKPSPWKVITRTAAVSNENEPPVEVSASVPQVVQRDPQPTVAPMLSASHFDKNSYAAKLLSGVTDPPKLVGVVYKRTSESASTSPSTREQGRSSESVGKAVWVSQLEGVSDQQIKTAVENRLKGCPIEGRVTRVERMRNRPAGVIELDSEECVPILLERGLCLNGKEVRIDLYKQSPSREPSPSQRPPREARPPRGPVSGDETDKGVRPAQRGGWRGNGRGRAGRRDGDSGEWEVPGRAGRRSAMERAVTTK